MRGLFLREEGRGGEGRGGREKRGRKGKEGEGGLASSEQGRQLSNAGSAGLWIPAYRSLSGSARHEGGRFVRICCVIGSE